MVVIFYDRRFWNFHTPPHFVKWIEKHNESIKRKLPNCSFYYNIEHHLYHAICGPHTYSKNKESLVNSYGWWWGSNVTYLSRNRKYISY